MKGLAIFGLVSLLIVSSLSVYSCAILEDYDRAEKDQQDKFLAAKAALEATGAPKESAEGKPLRPDRFALWMQARDPVATIWQDGIRDQKVITILMVRRLRNETMQTLADQLAATGLSFVEYNQISRRFRALLAMKQHADLRNAWKDTVRTQNEPEGIELPKPAANATEAEHALLKTHDKALRAQFHADLLTRQLEIIESDLP
ncbi:MAG: hypothetical protein AAGD14_05160 [Planctomycetota bacterium]